MSYNFLIIIFILTIGSVGFAAQEAPKEWSACSNDIECGPVEVGCWSWVIANKKYFDWVQKNMGSQVCIASEPPGPKPVTACIDHVCMDKWNSCSQNSDCTSVAVFCTGSKESNWRSGNKKFIKDIEMSEHNDPDSHWKTVCGASYDPGPGPGVQCIDKACNLIW